MSEEETSFTFKPDGIENLPSFVRNEAIEEIALFVRDSILDYVGQGKSPIAGGRYKSTLSKDYADREKAGDRLANLDLEGDMLNALDYRISGNSITVGIFDSSQAVKSYAHNTGYEGHPTLANKGFIRQFIPQDDQLLKADILRGIQRIIADYEDE